METSGARDGIDERTLAAALASARASRARAHAPHSGFRVGAAVVGSSGAVHTGCNVESASFGLTLCAERAALAAWVDAGGPARGESVVAVVIATRADRPTPPCGACRQWIAELAPGAVVVSEAAAGEPSADGGGRGDAQSAPSAPGGGGGGAALPGQPDPVVASWRIDELLPEAFRGDDLPSAAPARD